MKKKVFFLILILLLIPALAFAHGHGEGPHGPGQGPHGPGMQHRDGKGPHGRQGPMENFKKELDLTDDQVDKIREMKQELGYEVLQLKLEIEKNKVELAQNLLEENIRDSKVKSNMKKISELQYRIEKNTHSGFEKTMDILNKDQQKKFNDMMNKRWCKDEESCKSREKMKSKIKEKMEKRMKEKGINRDKIKDKMKTRFMEDFDASEAQVNELEKLKKEQREEARKLREQLRENREKLRELLADEKRSEKKINSKLKEISGLQYQIQLQQFESFKKELAVLNKEQQKLYKMHHVKRLVEGGRKEKFKQAAQKIRKFRNQKSNQKEHCDGEGPHHND